MNLFEEAVEIDPGFAEAWAGLSRAHTALIWLERHDPDELSKAKAAAERAVQLGPDLPETHIALGYYYYYATMDYDRALQHFRTALELRPGDAEALTDVGLILRRKGRWEEALEYFRDAARVDPRNYTLINGGLGFTNFFLRRYSETERHLRRAISLQPGIPVAYLYLAWLHICRDGDLEAASKVFQESIDKSDPSQYPRFITSRNADLVVRLLPEAGSRILDEIESRGLEGRTGAFLGELYLAKAELSLRRDQSQLATAYFDSARVALESVLLDQKADLLPSPRLSAHIALGSAYAGLGLKEEALKEAKTASELLPVSKDALEGALVLQRVLQIQVRAGEYDASIDLLETLLSIPSLISVHLLEVDPIWDPLRDHPRFQRLLEKYAETGS